MRTGEKEYNALISSSHVRKITSSPQVQPYDTTHMMLNRDHRMLEFHILPTQTQCFDMRLSNILHPLDIHHIVDMPKTSICAG